MKRCLLVLFLLIGCNRAIEQAKDAVGLGPTPEQVAAQKELLAQQLKDADVLVSKWADKTQGSNTFGNGFSEHVEGLTDFDPWGKPIRVEYRQDGFSEVAMIKSAGPDGTFDTLDDISRSRKVLNIFGNPLSWFLSVWFVCAVMAFSFSAGVSNRRVKHGKSGHHRHPAAFVLMTTCLAPLFAMLYGIQFLGGAMGCTGDFFDGFDFDFDIDLDIDLDI